MKAPSTYEVVSVVGTTIKARTSAVSRRGDLTISLEEHEGGKWVVSALSTRNRSTVLVRPFQDETAARAYANSVWKE